MWQCFKTVYQLLVTFFRGGSRAAATSKMECFVIIVNGWKSLTIITKHSILDIPAVLDPPLFFKPDVAGLDPRTAYNSDIKNFDKSYFSIT